MQREYVLWMWEGPISLNYPFSEQFLFQKEKNTREQGDKRSSAFLPECWHRSHLPLAITDVPTYSIKRTSCFQAEVENREAFCLWPKDPSANYLCSIRAVATRMKFVFYKNNFAIKLLDWKGRGDPGLNKFALKTIFQAICICIAEPLCCLSHNVWPDAD